jgi:3-deoxy-D-manno-octulosonic-acid transferase
MYTVKMRYLYTFSFYLLLPFILLRLLWRSKKNVAYRQRIAERLGYYATAPLAQSIWIHAVSYGEAVAAEPLIARVKQLFPDYPIVVTTMTITGSARVVKIWGSQVHHVYLPYDLPGALQRFFAQTNPRFAIIMETELWPNLLNYAGNRKLPILLANARLSERSLAGYRRLANFFSTMINNIHLVAAQSHEDAARFITLGVSQDRVSVTGNLKFDIAPPDHLITAGKQTRAQWSQFDYVWVAASTHVGEEEQILQSFARIRQHLPKTLLILVPRHPERFQEVADLCVKHNFTIARRSLQQTPDMTTQVFLGDTMGELYFFYAMADVAFVGGSLVPIGGHNLLEPSALKIPVIIGQYSFNFTAVCQLLKNAEALITVSTLDELTSAVLKLLQNEQQRVQQGARGYAVVIQNRGAVEKHMVLIKKILQT